MPPRPTDRAVKHGTISARQWTDIRQAARLARSEGVEIHMHGVHISPPRWNMQQQQQQSRKPQQQQQQQQSGETCTVPDADAEQPMETDGCKASASKKQQRDAQRLQEFQGRKRAARWRHFTRRLVLTTVWTSWMRERPERERQHAARRKLREALWLRCMWREWTRPQFGTAGSSVAHGGEQPHGLLGQLSHRDLFIRKRARAFFKHQDPPPGGGSWLVEMLTDSGRLDARVCSSTSDVASRWNAEAWGRRDDDGFDSFEIEDAVAASLEAQPPLSPEAMTVLAAVDEEAGPAESVEDECRARSPSADRRAITRSSAEPGKRVGNPATPDSARQNRRQRRGRRS